jgi:hypothetical protein
MRFMASPNALRGYSHPQRATILVWFPERRRRVQPVAPRASMSPKENSHEETRQT